ncbi:MAG: Lrp/AsnC ligand binding domain-containing protein [Archaeoglobaceae archaeon]|nr:Lrp/AsnC ligand binding domain-containing protein [Archaeoglobaceae archaeon]MDW7989276.1 Lrp/AsnC ligand binding domain-containing protein [Archaeoglobaceae archaeon]
MNKKNKDIKIVIELIKNGRVKKTELAKMLNVTETAIRKRIEKMEKNKTILGYKAIVDFKKLNLFSSLTGIDVEPEHLWRVVEIIRKMNNVSAAYLTSGDHVIIIEVICDSVDSLISFHENLSKIEGVKRVCPSMVLEVVK